MVYLIADLLNVSRLKTGKFIIDAVPTNLAKVAESELDQLTETAKMKGIKLSFKKPADFPTLMLDETKIRQVIMNFADNAIYYTQAGGEVTIELRDDRKRVYFLVKDSGIGVPKDEQEHLFNKFYRAKNAQKARPDGTGLGLFMAKKVVAAQDGDIIFESHEGQGSTFGFSFEKAKLQSAK
jgi:signal transduction histidine kinase